MRKRPQRSAADFTDEMIKQIFERDRHRCLFCGSWDVTIQHRRGRGMGGLGDKATPLTAADGVTLCGVHNEWATNGDPLAAKKFGWTVERKCPMPCNTIPYFDMLTASWWLPSTEGDRFFITKDIAFALIDLALA